MCVTVCMLAFVCVCVCMCVCVYVCVRVQKMQYCLGLVEVIYIIEHFQMFIVGISVFFWNIYIFL